MVRMKVDCSCGLILGKLNSQRNWRRCWAGVGSRVAWWTAYLYTCGQGRSIADFDPSGKGLGGPGKIVDFFWAFSEQVQTSAIFVQACFGSSLIGARCITTTLALDEFCQF